MLTEKELLEKDKNFSVICREIKEKIPHIESIILIGSRSIDEEIELPSLNSDYDIVVIMRTVFIPFYYKKIKDLDVSIGKKINNKVSINPLPLFRVKNSKGNYFLYKMGRDGVVLYGRDYRELMCSMDVKEIDKDWYFFYLAFLAKELIFSFDPALLYKTKDETESEFNSVTHSAIKSLIGCCELLLLHKGIYETNPEKILKEISKPKYRIDESYLEDLKLAVDIKKNYLDYNDNPIELWLRAKRRLFETFHSLMKEEGFEYESHEKLIKGYFKNSATKNSMKNFQFFISTLLIKREIRLKALFSKHLIDDRIRVALFWLLYCSEEEKLNEGGLLESYQVLRDYIEVECPPDEIMFWREQKKAVEIYFPYACTALGVW